MLKFKRKSDGAEVSARQVDAAAREQFPGVSDCETWYLGWYEWARVPLEEGMSFQWILAHLHTICSNLEHHYDLLSFLHSNYEVLR